MCFPDTFQRRRGSAIRAQRQAMYQRKLKNMGTLKCDKIFRTVSEFPASSSLESRRKGKRTHAASTT